MKTKFYLALAFIAALITTSCNENNNGHTVVTQTIPGCFSNVIDEDTQANELTDNLTIGMSIDYTDGTSAVSITGLKLPDGSSYPSMQLVSLPITQKEEWFIIQSEKPTIDSGNNHNVPTITNFELRLLQRVFGSGASADYQPALAVSFKCNGKYTVYITRSVQFVSGTTICTGENNTFTTKETIYGFGVDASKNILEIAMQNAQFMQGMPRMNFNLKNISFKMQGNAIVFSAERVIPTVGNTPNERFPITDLSGTLDPINGFTLIFDCNPGSVGGKSFVVNAQGSFKDMPNTQE